MKLLGVTNNKQVVASISHYDCRFAGEGGDEIFTDGGQIGLQDYAGYTRNCGKSIWFEVSQTFAELYNDYNQLGPRKYGVWDLADVKVLDEKDWPDTSSFEWKAENAIWGTNGPNGNLPTHYVMLKDCEFDHLKKIKELLIQRGQKDLEKIVDYWIESK